jgi:hypothetical protein
VVLQEDSSGEAEATVEADEVTVAADVAGALPVAEEDSGADRKQSLFLTASLVSLSRKVKKTLWSL